MSVEVADSAAKVVSLGCRLNIAESERIRAMLAEERDIVVINSCAVTLDAVRQTRKAIRQARRANPHARLLVTGCAAETERAQLSAMDEVDGLIDNAAKLDARAWNIAESKQATPDKSRHTRAFIAIQNGCDHACTFCIIPQGRGRSRSLPIMDVLREVERHLVAGAAEIVLTGVDVTSWGHDLSSQPPLGELVAAILTHFPELRRLRMSSLDGVEIDPLLLDLFADEQRLMPHLHLSLQHGSDLILKRMKRRHLRKDAIRLVSALKSKRPEIAIGADLIAGFPTETEAHHADNLSIIEELDIVHGHVFPYSPRSGTPAARMPQLPRPTVKERAAQLRERVANARHSWLDGLKGTDLNILVESDGTGYAENYARVAAPPHASRGEIVAVRPQSVENGLLT
ncbi:tRNA (N(6)-L-threonylcarbamoyladenosine(37)-C(2))-methylthiotransferase MtaB [Altererythrobacter aurantiacus]|uniref:tRNA (N(6)-L-threonylcarbamoyladenosine(37)-C(2))-methylthiotransferase MtaB n=2 Tax=Parapontixanthobacter aurantiacus TaxID=1463599 RepID=A0A844ZCU0_9SPHN|nr:tRNA (N(6)-L-threonylcarbamoyladenosine(37)-C(2))-methylthiotransferase MtaB [Parapontixanthobacter aurantiacus]